MSYYVSNSIETGTFSCKILRIEAYISIVLFASSLHLQSKMSERRTDIRTINIYLI